MTFHQPSTTRTELVVLPSASPTPFLWAVFAWERKLLFWEYRVNRPKGQAFKSSVPQLSHKGALTCLSVSKSPLEVLSTQISLLASLHSYVWDEFLLEQYQLWLHWLPSRPLGFHSGEHEGRWGPQQPFNQLNAGLPTARKEGGVSKSVWVTQLQVGKATFIKWPVQISLLERGLLWRASTVQCSWEDHGTLHNHPSGSAP